MSTFWRFQRMNRAESAASTRHNLCDRVSQRYDVERLGDEPVAASVPRHRFVRLHCVGRDCHDDDVSRGRVRFDPSRRLPSIDAGHLKIHQNQHRFSRVRQFQRRFSICGFNNSYTAVREIFREHFSIVRRVVDDDDDVGVRFRHIDTLSRTYSTLFR